MFKTLFKVADVLYRINYGGQKDDGSHSHIYNTGKDRTPNQKAGDEKRRGPRNPKK